MSKDLAASVRARLLNIAKAEGVDFNQVLVRYTLERFLYRLSQSPHADRFVLKGALYLRSGTTCRTGPPETPTCLASARAT